MSTSTIDRPITATIVHDLIKAIFILNPIGGTDQWVWRSDDGFVFKSDDGFEFKEK